MRRGRAKSRCRCGSGEPSSAADVAGEPSPGADVAAGKAKGASAAAHLVEVSVHQLGHNIAAESYPVARVQLLRHVATRCVALRAGRALPLRIRIAVAERTLLSRTACLPPPRDSLIIARRVRMSADQKSHSSLPTGPSGLHRQVTTRLALRSRWRGCWGQPVAVHAHPVEADVKLLRDDRRTAEDVHLRVAWIRRTYRHSSALRPQH